MSLIKFKLDEIANVVDCEHKTAPKIETSEFYSIRTPDIKNGRLLYEQANRVTEETYELWTRRAVPEEGDIILAREAPVGEVGWIDKDHKICLGQRTVLIKVHSPNIDKKYLLYSFVSPKFKQYLNELSGGSVVSHLNMKDIRALEFEFPPFPEQQAIASVLSALDDKIDLLQRQNQTLEQMAATLFRQWFIEEAKEDWENTTFMKWILETKGGDWGKENPIDEFQEPVYCIRGTDIADLQKGLPESTPLRFIKSKKLASIAPDIGDIIIEISGGTETQSTGRCTYINEEVKQIFSKPIVFSNFCRLLKVKDYRYSYFVYLYLQYLYKNDEFFALENGTSGIKNLNYKYLITEQLYQMPSMERVYEFHHNVSDLFKKINTNKIQTQTLQSLRDTLLPKLINGEVRLKGFDTLLQV